MMSLLGLWPGGGVVCTGLAAKGRRAVSSFTVLNLRPPGAIPLVVFSFGEKLLALFARWVRSLVLTALALTAFSAAAHATTCSSPAGNAGDIVWNQIYNMPQYCNGSNWIAMGSGVNFNSGMVAWYKLDDGSGTSAADSSGHGNTGTLQNTPTWGTGQIGDALTFNGTNQYVQFPDVASTQISGSWTISSWVKLGALPSSGNQAWFIFKPNSNGGPNYETNVSNTAGTYSWNVIFSDSGNNGHSASYATSISTGTWYFVTGVWDSSTSNLYLYVNGALVASQNTGGAVPLSGAACCSGTPLLGGEFNGSYGDMLNGSLDDVRVYNRALNANEVAGLYLAGLASGDITSNLVAEWKFDEGSGTSTADATGNGHTGTLTNAGGGLPTWTAGEINDAINFCGRQLELRGRGQRSRSLGHVGPDGLGMGKRFPGGGHTFIDKRNVLTPFNSYYIGADTTNMRYSATIENAAGSGGASPLGNNGDLVTGVWQNVALTYDGANAQIYVNGVPSGGAVAYTGGVYSSDTIFNVGSNPWDSGFVGSVDDVRVYSRALSANDLKTLYLTGTPSALRGGDTKSNLNAWWKLDEGTGTSTADSIGNGNTGTLVASPTWGAGKIGDDLTFNGTSQYVDVGNGANINFEYTQPFSISAWIYPVAGGTGFSTILSKRNTIGPYQGIEFDDDYGCNCLLLDVYGSTSSTGLQTFSNDNGTLPLNAWHHVVTTYDGTASNTSVKMYIDGVDETTPASNNDLTATILTSTHMMIGTWQANPNYFPGQIDDVRIYSRVLNQADVAALYTQGSSCSSPAANDASIIYNGPYHVAQYCDGKNWKPMGPVPGSGGGHCANPSGAEGDLLYNSDYSVMQYCDGTKWRGIGGKPTVNALNNTQDLVAWYKLDDGSGTTAIDSSTYGNTGTTHNSPTWGTGVINGDLTFNGTTQYVSVPDASSLDISGSWTVSTWVNLSALPTTGNGWSLVMKNGVNGVNNPANYGLVIDNGYYGTSGGAPEWAAYFNDLLTHDIILNSTAPISTGVWYDLAAVWDSSTSNLYLYVNGALSATENTPFTPASPGGGGLSVGSDGASNYSSGSFDDSRVYRRALNAGEIAALYEAGNPTGAQPNSLIAWWKLDESSGTTALDSTGNGNTGTLTNGPVWEPAGGEVNGALQFDGVDDDVTSSLPLASYPVTACAWVNYDSATSVTSVIIGTSGGAPFRLYLINDVGNQDYLTLYNNNGGVSSASDSIRAGVWNHICAVADASNNGSVYINGVLAAGPTNMGAATFPGSFLLGSESGGGNNCKGLMDDVRIYNYALTGTEIANLYATTAALNAPMSGLVGWWKLDESSGTTAADSSVNAVSPANLVGWWKLDDASGTTAADSSGSGNNGTLNNGPTWGTGEINGDLNFTAASSQYVNVPDATSLDIAGSWTVSAWVNLNSLPASNGYYGLISNTGPAGTNYGLYVQNVSNGIGCSSTEGWAVEFTGTTTTNNVVCGTTAPATGAWYLVTGVWDSVAGKEYLYVDGALAGTTTTAYVPTSGSANGMRIGKETDGVQYADAQIDDVRVYGRALSAAEIFNLYLYPGHPGTLGGSPVWKPSGGLDNGALQFNAELDFVSLGASAYAFDIANSFTIAAWVYRSSNANVDDIFANGNNSVPGYDLDLPASGTCNGCVEFDLEGTVNHSNIFTPAGSVTNGVWHHIVATYDGTGSCAPADAKIYVDGVDTGATCAGGNPSGTMIGSGTLIGSDSDAGTVLDDVRIYDRVLSGAEVLQLYKATGGF